MREGSVQLSMSEDICACIEDCFVESETNTAMESGRICETKGNWMCCTVQEELGGENSKRIRGRQRAL